MDTRVSRHVDGRSFLEAAEPFLLRREAENNVILGNASTIAQPSADNANRPYLATVELDSEIVGCAMRNPPYKLVITGLPAEAVSTLAIDAADFCGGLPGVFGPEPVAALFAERWSARTGCAAQKGRRQRIYQAERLVPLLHKPPGMIRLARPADLELVTAWIAGFVGEAQPAESLNAAELAADRIKREILFLWEDAEPVSMAAWTGKTPNGVRVNLVYTPPAFRRRGYASACVHALSELLLERGNRLCFLFTDLANPVSNRIYQRIGYQPVCDVTDYEFVG